MSEEKAVYIPLASKLHDPKTIDSLNKRIYDSVSHIVDYALPKITDVNKLDRIRINNAALYIVAVLTGGTEHLILKLAHKGKPLALIVHDAQNSLAAALEAKSRINLENVCSKIFLYGEDNFPDEIMAFAEASKTIAKLRKSKILLVDEPSPWLIYSSIQTETLLKKLNVSFKKVTVDELMKTSKQVNLGNRVKNKIKELSKIPLKEPSEKELYDNIKIYFALKKLIEKHNANMVSIRCFDLIKYGVTACLALSMLNDEGYIAGCEGDIPATITMAILSFISKTPAFMGNIAWIKENKILISHCTIPTKLVLKYRFRSHFESGIGVGIEGYFKPRQQATFARLDSLRRILRAGIGEITNRGPICSMNCRTQMLIKVQGNAKLIIDKPIGNHYVVVIGNHLNALRYLSEMLGYTFERI